MDPVGAYDDLDEATEWVDRLDKINTNPKHEIFDVIDFDIGDQPIIMDQMQKLWESTQDTRTKYVQDMMDKGWIDQLIGEDGNFYYKITPTGKKVVNRSKKFQKIISMFQEKEEE